MAGVRDLALGIWQARAVGDREELARATASVAACDAGDTFAFAALAGSGNRAAGIKGLAAALPATVAGAFSPAGLRRGGPRDDATRWRLNV